MALDRPASPGCGSNRDSPSLRRAALFCFTALPNGCGVIRWTDGPPQRRGHPCILPGPSRHGPLGRGSPVVVGVRGLAARQRSRSSRDGGIEPEIKARSRRRMRPFVEAPQRRDRAQDPVAAGQHFFDGLLVHSARIPRRLPSSRPRSCRLRPSFRWRILHHAEPRLRASCHGSVRSRRARQPD